jgi:hypothetical protein
MEESTAEYLSRVTQSVGFGEDDYRPHETLAAVADMVEGLGAPLQFSDVVGALRIILGQDPDDDDIEALAREGFGLWSAGERAKKGGG